MYLDQLHLTPAENARRRAMYKTASRPMPPTRWQYDLRRRREKTKPAGCAARGGRRRNRDTGQ